MALKIYWTDFSKSELHQIFDYYRQKAGTRVAIKLVEGIIYETLKLSEQPLIGQVEELLTERAEGFRHLVHKNYKIIYWINRDMNRIEIADIFDTRQNPLKMKRK